MKRGVIYSQVVLFHLLRTDDRAFLKASLRVDQDTELSEQLVMARASTVPCNSKEFSCLFELCSHFRHRRLAEAEPQRITTLLRAINYSSIDFLGIAQHLQNFRELFEFLKNDIETMKKTLERNGIDPNILIACEEVEYEAIESEDFGNLMEPHIFHMEIRFGRYFKIVIRSNWDTFLWHPEDFVSRGDLAPKAYSIKTLFQCFEEKLGSL